MKITVVKELEVGSVRIILKKYEGLSFSSHKEEWRVFVNALATNNPLQFHGPYYTEPVGKAQMSRIAKDPRWNGWKKAS